MQGEVLVGATGCMLRLATIAKGGLTVESLVPASSLSVDCESHSFSHAGKYLVLRDLMSKGFAFVACT